MGNTERERRSLFSFNPRFRALEEKPQAMSMESLEFIIYPDGRVQEKVTGIVGRSCTEITAAIEEQLGRVMSVDKTSDYYALEQQRSQKTTNPQTIWADWEQAS